MSFGIGTRSVRTANTSAKQAGNNWSNRRVFAVRTPETNRKLAQPIPTSWSWRNDWRPCWRNLNPRGHP
jgi:hypothetical protein